VLLPRSGQAHSKQVFAFTVNARDTNGCGDVFHGALTPQRWRAEWSFRPRIRFASAAAAIKAQRAGGPAGISDAGGGGTFSKLNR